MKQSDTFHKSDGLLKEQKITETSTNLSFLTANTGKMYLYAFKFLEGTHHIES